MKHEISSKEPARRCRLSEYVEIIKTMECDVELNFSTNADGSDYYGITLKKLFDGEVLLLGHYGAMSTSLLNLVNENEDQEIIDWLSYCTNCNDDDYIYIFDSLPNNLKEKYDEHIVSSFLYYMWNAWHKEECKIVFGWQWEHFWSKWIHHAKETAKGAAEKFYADLSDNYRTKLVRRACEIYDRDSRRE